MDGGLSVHYECLFPGILEGSMVKHAAWVAVFAQTSGPSDSLERLNLVYSTYQKQLMELVIHEDQSQLHQEVSALVCSSDSCSRALSVSSCFIAVFASATDCYSFQFGTA